MINLLTSKIFTFANVAYPTNSSNNGTFIQLGLAVSLNCTGQDVPDALGG